jgi:hypothetical protein
MAFASSGIVAKQMLPALLLLSEDFWWMLQIVDRKAQNLRENFWWMLQIVGQKAQNLRENFWWMLQIVDRQAQNLHVCKFLFSKKIRSLALLKFEECEKPMKG